MGVAVLVYSLVAKTRTIGTPVCSADGSACDYGVKATDTGYVHASIPAGNELLKRLAAKHQFETTIYEGNTRDTVAQEFTLERLSKFRAVVFLNPNGLGLSATQREAFRSYINQGGAYVGIHAGANCETDWPWLHDLVGSFETGVVTTSDQVLTVVPGISTDNLPPNWHLNDEWLKRSRSVDTRPNIKVLVRREGGEPVSWYQEYEGGRMWYTGLGHNSSTFGDAGFEDHVWGGIRWAARLP